MVGGILATWLEGCVYVIYTCLMGSELGRSETMNCKYVCEFQGKAFMYEYSAVLILGYRKPR